jgi:hypothetical protein
MSVSSRRGARMTPAVEMLEERRLLSHFSVPFSPAWGFPGGHGGAPPAFLATAPGRQEGPFGGDPGSFAQGRLPQGNSSPASAAAPIANVGPASAASPSVPSVQAAIPLAQPTDFVPDGLIGESALDQANATASNPVNPPVVELALPKAPDTPVGPVSPGISGSARPAPVSMGFALPQVLIAPAWAVQFRALTRMPLTVWSGDIGVISDLTRRSVGPLPAPLGADLITHLAAFGQAPIGESILRLFGRQGGSGERSLEHLTLNHAHLLLIALAVAALEAGRRYTGRQSRTSGQSRRWRNSLLMGLPRTFR